MMMILDGLSMICINGGVGCAVNRALQIVRKARSTYVVRITIVSRTCYGICRCKIHPLHIHSYMRLTAQDTCMRYCRDLERFRSRCCCRCCLHIKKPSRSRLYPVPPSVSTSISVLILSTTPYSAWVLLTPANCALSSDPVCCRTAFNCSCSSGVKESGRRHNDNNNGRFRASKQDAGRRRRKPQRQ